MLVLTRKLGERIYIGPSVSILVVDIDRRGKIKLGVEAPRDVEVMRGELLADDDPRISVNDKESRTSRKK